MDLKYPADSSQSVLSYCRGKSTMKWPKHWNTRDLLNETTAPQGTGMLQASTRQKQWRGDSLQPISVRISVWELKIHPKLILAKGWWLCLCVCVSTYNNSYIKYQWSLFNTNFTILVKLWCLSLFFEWLRSKRTTLALNANKNWYLACLRYSNIPTHIGKNKHTFTVSPGEKKQLRVVY